MKKKKKEKENTRKPQPRITALCPFYRTKLESWSLSRAQVLQQIRDPVSVNWIGKYGGLDGKEITCDVGDLGSTPRSGRSLEKGMATHSSILAWRIPWTEEPGGL